MLLQRPLLLYVATNSITLIDLNYWDCKLPCIRDQVELWSTYAYDYKISTGGSSALM